MSLRRRLGGTADVYARRFGERYRLGFIVRRRDEKILPTQPGQVEDHADRRAAEQGAR